MMLRNSNRVAPSIGTVTPTTPATTTNDDDFGYDHHYDD